MVRILDCLLWCYVLFIKISNEISRDVRVREIVFLMGIFVKYYCRVFNEFCYRFLF